MVLPLARQSTFPEDKAVGRIVIDDKNPLSRNTVVPLLRSVLHLLFRFDKRNSERERTACSGHTFDANSPPHQINKSSTDCQPQPVPP